MVYNFTDTIKKGGHLTMNGKKILLSAVCAFVAVAAAITAIIVFRNEIIEFFVEVKEKIDAKRFHRNGEYADFADI